jgi:hypothetical protein
MIDWHFAYLGPSGGAYGARLNATNLLETKVAIENKAPMSRPVLTEEAGAASGGRIPPLIVEASINDVCVKRLPNFRPRIGR